MRKLFLILLIYLFNFNLTLAQTNIAFIDMDKVLSTSKPGLSIMTQLKDINSNNKNKFDDEAKKLKEKETKLISQKNILSEKDFQLNINKLKLEFKKFNEIRNKKNSDLNKLKIDSTNKVLKLINPILIKFSNEKSISLILQKKNLILGKTELDITDEIIMIINDEINEFKIN
jgi:outer membrane protein|tara:strand:+ start:181 stop:699 length:519 start_codon:yes stop_codon:yes gene_type:complete